MISDENILAFLYFLLTSFSTRIFLGISLQYARTILRGSLLFSELCIELLIHVLQLTHQDTQFLILSLFTLSEINGEGGGTSSKPQSLMFVFFL